jgi:hypothetical protein
MFKLPQGNPSMISRFFKKKPKAAEPKKATTKPSRQESVEEATPLKPKKLLTAEGWKRLMMGKTGKKK